MLDLLTAFRIICKASRHHTFIVNQFQTNIQWDGSDQFVSRDRPSLEPVVVLLDRLSVERRLHSLNQRDAHGSGCDAKRLGARYTRRSAWNVRRRHGETRLFLRPSQDVVAASLVRVCDSVESLVMRVPRSRTQSVTFAIGQRGTGPHTILASAAVKQRQVIGDTSQCFNSIQYFEM